MKPSKLIEILNQKKEFLKDKGLLKALPSPEERAAIIDFIEDFNETKNPDKDQLKVAKKILQIGKTYYEFANAEEGSLTPRFIRDSLYDALLGAFKKAGENEPTGFIPAGGFEKKKIEFTTLANNLDKCYRLKEDDELPKGVKEELSVQKFINNVFKECGLDKKDDTVEVMLSPKIDGASANTKIKELAFKNPLTRGTKGEGVYLKYLEGVTLTTSEKAKALNGCGIQFEVFTTNKGRKKLSNLLKLPKDYVSNRKAASSVLLRHARPIETTELSDNLCFYPITAEGLDEKYEDMIELIELFARVPDDMIKRKTVKGNAKELLEKIQKYMDEITEVRPDLTYSIDGMVITVVKKSLRDILGRSGNTNNFEVAYKFNPNVVKAIAEKLILESGNLGYMTAQLYFREPIELDGGEYDHVHISKREELESLDLHKGDEILVVYTGDVMPAIAIDESCIRNKNGESLHEPDTCPTCYEKLHVENGKLRCTKKSCPEVAIGRLTHFVQSIGLEDFSYGTMKDLYLKCNVTKIADLFNVTEEQLRNIGYDKKADKFVKEIKRVTKGLKDYEFLGSLGIDGLRVKRAISVLKLIDLEKLDKYTKGDIQMLLYTDTKIRAISEEVARELDACRSDIKFMLQFISKDKTDYDNSIFVTTTKVDEDSDMGKELMKIIDKGSYQNRKMIYTDSGKFDLLITGGPDTESKKVEKAKKNGITIRTIEDFVRCHK